MITAEAGRALGLVNGIDTIHHPNPDFWRQCLIYMIVKMGFGEAEDPMATLIEMLREQWALLDMDAARAKPLAEIGDPIVVSRNVLVDLVSEGEMSANSARRLMAIGRRP